MIKLLGIYISPASSCSGLQGDEAWNFTGNIPQKYHSLSLRWLQVYDYDLYVLFIMSHIYNTEQKYYAVQTYFNLI